MRAPLFGLVLAVAATPAGADWQFTRWGMSPQETGIASGGLLRVPARPDVYDDGQQVHQLSGEYGAAGIGFESKFIFDRDDRLIKVILVADPGDCPGLGRALINTYGPAEIGDFAAGRVLRWWDADNGNVVSLQDMGSLWCHLIYEPFLPAGQEGGL